MTQSTKKKFIHQIGSTTVQSLPSLPDLLQWIFTHNVFMSSLIMRSLGSTSIPMSVFKLSFQSLETILFHTIYIQSLETKFENDLCWISGFPQSQPSVFWPKMVPIYPLTLQKTGKTYLNTTIRGGGVRFIRVPIFTKKNLVPGWTVQDWGHTRLDCARLGSHRDTITGPVFYLYLWKALNTDK